MKQNKSSVRDISCALIILFLILVLDRFGSVTVFNLNI